MDLQNFTSVHGMPVPYKFGHCVQICGKQSLIVRHRLRIRAEFYVLRSNFSVVSPVIHNYPLTPIRKGNHVCRSLGSPNQGVTPHIMIMKENIFCLARSIAARTGGGMAPIMISATAVAFVLIVWLLVRIFKLTDTVASELLVIAFASSYGACFCVANGLAVDQIFIKAGLVGIILSLLGRKILANILSGVLLLKQHKLGDIVHVKMKNCDITGTIEGIGLFSPFLVRSVSGEMAHFPNDILGDSSYVNLTVGSYKCISFRFEIGKTEAHLVDEILADLHIILRKFSTHDDDDDEKDEDKKDEKKKDEIVRNIARVETMDLKHQNITILVSCLVEAADVACYLKIRGTIILEVFKLLARVIP